jgi:hypothetical protein
MGALLADALEAVIGDLEEIHQSLLPAATEELAQNG